MGAERCLWVCRRQVEKAIIEHRGVPIPEVPAGHTRHDSDVEMFRITPTSGLNCPSGLRMTVVRHMQISHANHLYLGSMTSASLRARFHGDIAKFMERLRDLLRDDRVAQRIADSPRSPFFEQVRRRLATIAKQ